MYDVKNLDHLSVGMKHPNGDYTRPIRENSMFWMKPGKKLFWMCVGCVLDVCVCVCLTVASLSV